MRSLKVLDLFAGTGSSTQAFVDRGHHVKRLEILPEFRAEYEMDIKQFAKMPERMLGTWRPDIVWASPVCTAFSMAGSGSRTYGSSRWRYDGPFPFYGPRLPTDRDSRLGCSWVLAALHIIRVLKPRYWWLENPMGGLKTMGFMEPVPGPVIVTYCQYGDTRMKPTTLWGEWPETWSPKPRCYNGDPCHEAAPRGARTGTQGLAGSKERSRVPYQLGESIAIACELAFDEGSLYRLVGPPNDEGYEEVPLE